MFGVGTQYYDNSTLRTYLTTTVYNGFVEEVKNAMKVQSFPSNDNTLNDKVKCPSLVEIGCNYYESQVIAEGTIYPIFGSRKSYPNYSAMYKYPNGNDPELIWTRSRSIGSTVNVWAVNSYGYCNDGYSYQYNFGAIACIRF